MERKKNYNQFPIQGHCIFISNIRYMKEKMVTIFIHTHTQLDFKIKQEKLRLLTTPVHDF